MKSGTDFEKNGVKRCTTWRRCFEVVLVNFSRLTVANRVVILFLVLLCAHENNNFTYISKDEVNGSNIKIDQSLPRA